MGVKYYRNLELLTPRELWSVGTTSEIQYVDGDYGANAATNQGWHPTRAVSSITQAVTNVTGFRTAVIYVRPRSVATSAQTYYTDNITIPLTTPGLSIIGAGSNPVRPFMGVALKVTTSTSALITILASDVHLEGMRLAGTGQNATDGISIIDALASAGSGATGTQIVNCRLDNAKTGGAINIDSPNHFEIVGCSFDECAVGITTVASTGSYASRGLKVIDCDFGGRNTVRDMDIYISQTGSGNATTGMTGYEILNCRFLDALPAKGGNNRYIKIANGDCGMIAGCYFACSTGGSNSTEFGSSGTQCIVPTTWFMAGCYSGNTTGVIDNV